KQESDRRGQDYPILAGSGTERLTVVAVADRSHRRHHTVIETAAGEQGLKLGKAQALVAVAVTGRTVGLPLFESLEALGGDRTLARIEAATAKLG
ncbi:hypothetical protein ACXGR9_35400, partial [Nocardia asiatica]